MNITEIDTYRTFVIEHDGLHPRLEVESERKLAVWAADIGQWCENGEVSPIVRDQLHAIPDWADTAADRIWLNKVREYQMWLDEHDGNHPRMNGVGTTPYERHLGAWAAKMRHCIRSTTLPMRNKEERAEILRQRIPSLLDNGWNSWSSTFREYVAWTLKHGARPKKATGRARRRHSRSGCSASVTSSA